MWRAGGVAARFSWLGWSAANVARSVSVMFMALLLMLSATLARAQYYRVLYNFTGAADGAFPSAGPSMDSHGNLYGTAFGGGSHAPTVSAVPGDRSVKISRVVKRKRAGWEG